MLGDERSDATTKPSAGSFRAKSRHSINRTLLEWVAIESSSSRTVMVKADLKGPTTIDGVRTIRGSLHQQKSWAALSSLGCLDRDFLPSFPTPRPEPRAKDRRVTSFPRGHHDNELAVFTVLGGQLSLYAKHERLS